MESMNRRISKNLLYNYILQVITILLPLALTPYLTRVIGATGIGEYAYTYSIAQYFVLAATLGTGIYGTRQIAYVRNNEKELKSTFWSIFILRFMISAITIVVYVIFFPFSLMSDEYIFYCK